MTDEHLREIENRIAAASPVPWDTDASGAVVIRHDCKICLSAAKRCETMEQHILHARRYDEHLAPDVDFIVNARQDLPDLLAAYKALLTEQAEIETRVWKEAAKEASIEGSRQGCLDCSSTSILTRLFLDKAAASAGEAK